MARSSLSAPHFQNEEAAFAYVEAHLWPSGPVCPHCGNVDQASIGRLSGKTTRTGLRKCYACRKPFTVRIGSIFEDSHLPLHLWLQVIHLMCASKKDISTRQVQRMLSCSMKTAWHLTHRIRLAMTDDRLPPMGGEGKTVEADETYFGRKPGTVVRRGTEHKNAVLALVERGGSARTVRIDRATTHNIKPIVEANVDPASNLMTDEARHYTLVGRQFASHESVEHGAGEYVRGDAHTNTIEGFFGVFKRGMKGIYQLCGEQHLHRYLSEFEFRYNHRTALGVEDAERTGAAVKGTKGKRLTYEKVVGA